MCVKITRTAKSSYSRTTADFGIYYLSHSLLSVVEFII